MSHRPKKISLAEILQSLRDLPDYQLVAIQSGCEHLLRVRATKAQTIKSPNFGNRTNLVPQQTQPTGQYFPLKWGDTTEPEEVKENQINLTQPKQVPLRTRDGKQIIQMNDRTYVQVGNKLIRTKRKKTQVLPLRQAQNWRNKAIGLIQQAKELLGVKSNETIAPESDNGKKIAPLLKDLDRAKAYQKYVKDAVKTGKKPEDIVAYRKRLAFSVITEKDLKEILKSKKTKIDQKVN
jgi:hypothetical protein